MMTMENNTQNIVSFVFQVGLEYNIDTETKQK